MMDTAVVHTDKNKIDWNDKVADVLFKLQHLMVLVETIASQTDNNRHVANERYFGC
jgi:hypothetical protein